MWRIIVQSFHIKSFDLTDSSACDIICICLQVKQILQPPIEGVVLQTYGAGNGPTSRSEMLDLFKDASDRGVLIINITQCIRGKVKMAYSTGKVSFTHPHNAVPFPHTFVLFGSKSIHATM